MKDNNTKNWKKIREQHEREMDERDEDLSDDDGQDGATGEGGKGGVFQGNASLEHPDYAGLEDKLTLAEQKAHENWEKSVRAMAELDNVRRRAERDVANAHRYGLEKIISSLLPVVDSLEQALQLVNKETDSGMAEGLQLTMKQFLAVLDKHDVEQIEPMGAPFDPQEHEAMSVLLQPDAAPNSVVAVFQKGYKLNGRVIRPARVIVAKNKAAD